MKRICNLSFLFALLFSSGAYAQDIIATPNNSGPALVQQLIGNNSNVQISNVGGQLGTDAAGIFEDQSGVLGINKGIFLTTGSATNIPGPNSTGNAGTNNSLSGDPDLDGLTTMTTYDAATLEFDFVAPADTIRFQYVFGSDEYNEWVNSSFNDVFAFILKGPGLPPEGVNLAKINNLPVSINSINSGSNPQFFINNDESSGSPALPFLQYDGYTQVLLAEYYPLQPGQTYHIKLAIADATDGNYDSGVFLRAGSFGSSIKCGTPTIVQSTPTAPICYDGTGSVTLNLVTGGSPPYKFSINGGSFVTGTVLSNVPVGDNTIKIIDKYGCPGTYTFTMPQSTRPVLRFRSVTRTNPTCVGCQNGRILVMGMGGTAPYKYSLDGVNYQTSNLFSNLGAGFYNVYVKDASGCIYKWFAILN